MIIYVVQKNTANEFGSGRQTNGASHVILIENPVFYPFLLIFSRREDWRTGKVATDDFIVSPFIYFMIILYLKSS